MSNNGEKAHLKRKKKTNTTDHVTKTKYSCRNGFQKYLI